MPKINLIKKKQEDDTIQYAAGPDEPLMPDAGDVWMNTTEGKFYVYDGSNWNMEDVEHVDFDQFKPDHDAAYDRAMGVV